MIRALLVIAMLAAPALADPTAQQQAKAHFKQARALQNSGQYTRAAAEYEAAYELDHRAEMLFNIAQAHRLGGEKQAALDYYQRYLAAQPDGAGAAEAREHIAELTKQLEAERPPPPPEPAAAPRPIAPPPIAPPVAPPHEDAPAPASQGSRTLEIAGIATAGAGVIALAVGVKFGLDARAAASDISQHTGDWTAADQARFDDGQRANRNMIIAYVGGGVLVAGGAVLFIVGREHHVAPMVGARAAGAMLWGRF